MCSPNQTMKPRAGWQDWLRTAFPPPLPQDSALVRRRKLAVRNGHLGMVILVAVAATGALVFRNPGQTLVTKAALLASSLAYIGWNLLGTQSLVQIILAEGGPAPRVDERRPAYGAAAYFGVQLGLAAAVYWLGDQGRVPNLVWLSLLPPVAYAVFFLRWPGITMVTLSTLVILLVGTLRWHGWRGAPYALAAFSVAIVFTLVFTMLVVSAETARHQAQVLAEELRAANEQLRRHAVEMEELAATRERNRLAREVHDSLGHYLTVVHMQLEAAQALAGTQPERAREALVKASMLTADGLRDIRDSVATLRAAPLENRRLAEALRDTVERHREGGLDCRFSVHGTERPLPPATALTLYRACQESLTNVQKHARARKAQLTLDYRQPDRVRFTAEDDGVGLAAGADRGRGFGLLGLRERLQLLGGMLSTSESHGGGFTLHVEVPG